MRKYVAICLLVLMVSIQTPVGQVFRIPLLIEHLLKHRQQNQVSLLDFLNEHYAGDHSDADLPEDEQLPFKTIIPYHIGHALVPHFIKAGQNYLLPLEKLFATPAHITIQQHLASIFHPPRTC